MELTYPKANDDPPDGWLTWEQYPREQRQMLLMIGKAKAAELKGRMTQQQYPKEWDKLRAEIRARYLEQRYLQWEQELETGKS
jgi:hypothetical protein